MKAEFSVEGEGFDEEGDNDSERNLLKEFVDYIKVNYFSFINSHLYFNVNISRFFIGKQSGCIRRSRSPFQIKNTSSY